MCERLSFFTITPCFASVQSSQLIPRSCLKLSSTSSLWPAVISSVGSNGESLPLIAENSNFPVSLIASSSPSVQLLSEPVPEVPFYAPPAKIIAQHEMSTSSTSSMTPIIPSCSLSMQTLSDLSVPSLQNSIEHSSAIADIFTQFGDAVQSNIDPSSSSIPLGTVYPEFVSCKSMAEVIQLSSELAPCSFDIDKARTAHKLNPKSLNSEILEADLLYAQTFGLQSLLTTRFRDAERLTLQPAIVSSDFKSVITFKNLHAVAVNGVVTETHSSFIPNFGVDCPEYPIDIADPDILIDHLHIAQVSSFFSLCTSCKS
jgi:hypothetical protein